MSKVGCTTLFVTHYPEVADGVAHDDGLLSARTVVAHMGYMVDSSRSSATGSGDGDVDGDGDGGGGSEERAKERVVFLYKAVEKASGGSYGLNAARLAGMATPLLHRTLLHPLTPSDTLPLSPSHLAPHNLTPFTFHRHGRAPAHSCCRNGRDDGCRHGLQCPYRGDQQAGQGGRMTED